MILLTGEFTTGYSHTKRETKNFEHIKNIPISIKGNNTQSQNQYALGGNIGALYKKGSICGGIWGYIGTTLFNETYFSSKYTIGGGAELGYYIKPKFCLSLKGGWIGTFINLLNMLLLRHPNMILMTVLLI